MIVIEMNPRVSRSSALASKATGFPIAWVATKLALGYRLWELPNVITGRTKAAFEPVLDYVVVKVPRFTFEKFPETEAVLGIQMKSVGEAMAIGRSFQEALQKALRSLEEGYLGLAGTLRGKLDLARLKEHLLMPGPPAHLLDLPGPPGGPHGGGAAPADPHLALVHPGDGGDHGPGGPPARLPPGQPARELLAEGQARRLQRRPDRQVLRRRRGRRRPRCASPWACTGR